MTPHAAPIRRKLMKMLLLTCGIVLLFTCASFFAYEFLTFRQTLVRQLDTLGQAIASNSTAALAFDNPDDASSVLAAFKADPHIVRAALFDAHGALFAAYPKSATGFPAAPGVPGYHFSQDRLAGFQAVSEGG